MAHPRSNLFTPSPCPVCKKKPAIMGATLWRPYEGEACSDECGLKAKELTQKLIESPQYCELMKKLARTEQQIALMHKEIFD